MSHPFPSALPPQSQPPMAWRIVRGLTVAAVGLMLSFFALLALAATTPLVRASLTPLVTENEVVSIVAAGVILLVVLLVPVLVLGRLVRRGILRTPGLVVLALVVAAGVGYLVWDEPAVLHPLTMEELAPALPGDEASFAVYLRYAKNAPAAAAVKSPKLMIGQATGEIVTKPENWEKYLRTNRAAIEAEWEALAPVRAWWDELAAAPRIGDLTPPRADAPIVAFQPVRSYAQFAVAIASLQALDGHGDEAAATLGKLFGVARKLEPNARTLVRAMIAKVMQRMALQATGFVLDHATLSAASRQALADEFRAAALGPAGARRLILIEYAFFQPMIRLFVEGAPVGATGFEKGLQKVVRVLGQLVVNRNATINLVGDRYYRMAELAEARRLGELELIKGPIDRERHGGYAVKNLGGRLIADMAMPALSKVIKSYWDIEDLRAATLARLKG